jgi:4-amino-4-deoxy-L-arabinose transferase-like glycosyltransferase
VVYAWLALGYLRATPPYNNPDEPAHVNYVAQVATTGTLPVLQPGDWDNDLLERLKATKFPPSESVAAVRYEGWQPPLYYVLAAPIYGLAMGLGREEMVDALRLFTVLLGALTLLVSYALARAAFGSTGSPWLALAVPLAMVGVPMFTAMSAAVTNDGLANLLAALLSLEAVRALRRPPTRAGSVRIGVEMGASLLTKLTVAPFVAVAGLALLVGSRRAGNTWRQALGLAVLAGAVGLLLWAPWLLRQGVAYGFDDLLASRRHDAVVVGQQRFPGLSGDFLRSWSSTLFHSFWAQFGWMGIPVADRYAWSYWLWGTLIALAVVGLAVAAVRRSSTSLPPVSVLACLGLLAAAPVVGLLVLNASFVQAQGRYLFSGLPVLTTLAVLGWSALVPGRPGVWLPVAVGLLLVALNWFTLARTLAPAFAG